jgi:predicted porin
VNCNLTVNGKAAKTCVATGANSFGPEVGSVFFYMDGKVRDDRIRYDSPVWNGFQLATSFIDGGATDIALRYGADWWGTTVVASVAETFATSLGHSACAAYCYSSGTPGAGPTLSGQANGLALQYGPSAAGSNQFDGSASILHPSGLNFTIAGGVQDPIYHDPFGQTVSPTLIYAKLGWQTPTPFFDIGKTAFAVSYAENDDTQYKNDEAKDYAFQIAQQIDAGAMTLFAGYHHQTLDRDFASYKPIDLVLVGGIARF